MAVDIGLAPSGAPRIGLPEKLFDVTPIGEWDVTGDGQRFLINVVVDQLPSSVIEPIRVMVNWQRPPAVK